MILDNLGTHRVGEVLQNGAVYTCIAEILECKSTLFESLHVGYPFLVLLFQIVLDGTIGGRETCVLSIC